MSARLAPQAVRPFALRGLFFRTIRQHHHLPSGGLLGRDAIARERERRRRAWFLGNAFHNAVTARNASFYRFLPDLALKFVRIPAMFGGLAVGAFAWVQYQANQASNFAIDVYNKTAATVSDTVSSVFGGVNGVAEQTMQGWDNTKAKIGLPNFLQHMFQSQRSDSDHTDSDGAGPVQPMLQSRAGGSTVAAAAAAAAVISSDKRSDDDDGEAQAKDNQMMVLTKKMIEIRNILNRVGQSTALSLPSIVVIGSQSSGKSSVLEAIVGHEFLPKGANMVTRRPIELTLVNTPNTSAEYGEFPDLGLGKISDFSSIQNTLTELNLAVPDSECVSDDPIHLTIYSPNVPDLSLIDLPGYIQVAGQNQPAELKQKITELCDKYIQPPNVILAISAADVDLANSTALRASRRVDPRGERTIGVITKMDLVEPPRGAALLTNNEYPLRLGYVGVIPKAPATQSLFRKATTPDLMSAISQNEDGFFSSHPLQYSAEAGAMVGTKTLRKRLMYVLERTMSASLQSTGQAIRQELEETTYEFKVQYNDRPLSAQSYLAESLDAFKHSFKRFTEEFGRPQMHELLKRELDQRVLDLLAARYWNKPVSDLSASTSEPDSLADLPNADPDSPYWRRQLDASSSSLTKLGVGRLATTVVANSIQAHVDALVNESTFSNHPFARQAITEAASSILNEKFYSTSDQVENCIKPYKFDIEIEEREWGGARQHVGTVLKKELQDCEVAISQLEATVGGRRKLHEVMGFVDRARKGDVMVEGEVRSGAGGFSAALLKTGREAVFLRDRANMIKMRMMAVKSKQCQNLQGKYHCPEVFLDAVATKLASTAILFLNVELLSEFYYNFPRELDSRLGRHLSEDEVERFASEDPRIRRHLELIRRKELLELVLDKMESLRQLDGHERDRDRDRSLERSHGAGSDQVPGRWSVHLRKRPPQQP